MSATTAAPWPSTVQRRDEPEAGLADQVATLLWLESGVLMVIVGREDGRTSGFLADLTHAISQHASVLRIRTPLKPAELFQALAGQLGVDTAAADAAQTAARVGAALRERDAGRRYVLVCEGSHGYTDATLETLRQLSNYPLNIVLCGTHRLLRRLNSAPLAALKQRTNYRLDLNEGRISAHARWLGWVAGLAAAGYLWLTWFTPVEKSAEEPVHRISRPGPPAEKPFEPPQQELQLTLERRLGQRPERAP